MQRSEPPVVVVIGIGDGGVQDLIPEVLAARIAVPPICAAVNAILRWFPGQAPSG